MARERKRQYTQGLTEDIWLKCEDWHSLGQELQGMVLDGFLGITDRKAQLFEVACARRVVHLLPSELCRRTVKLAEAAADAEGGPLTVCPLPTYPEIKVELDEYGPPPDYLPRPPRDAVTDAALELSASLADPEQLGARVRYMGGWAAQLAAQAAGTPEENPEGGAQLGLLHDVFGNPFRPLTIDPSWLTSTVTVLAQGIYDGHAFGRLPILADALQDAGCENEEILNHCRGPGPHVRGCWVVDLVLGKK